jgi:rare lipoprotein A
VAVPSAWVAPVAMNAPEASTMPVVPQTPMAPMAPMAPMTQAEVVAQAAPPTLDADAAQPPPRQPMVVTDLAPMAPLSAPTAPVTTPPAAAPSSAAAAGFWVQLGAFRERDGAESLRSQAARGLPSLAPQLRVFSEAGTHRLQAGPFASRNEAGEAVTQLRESLRIAPMVVERR